MKKSTLVAALAALSMVACARGHHEAAKINAPVAPQADTVVAEKAPSKRVNAIGIDMQCSAEFVASYPSYAQNVAVAAQILKNELNAMDLKVSKRENTVANSASVLAAYKDLSATFKDYKATFFPYLCWLPGANGKNVNFSSAEQQESFDKLRARVGKAIGTQLVGPQI